MKFSALKTYAIVYLIFLYAPIALLPMPTGELRLVKHGFRPISAFLRHGSVVPFDNLPTQFRARVLEAWLHRSPTLMH